MTLHFYMKSGNVIVIDGITSYRFVDKHGMSSVELTQKNSARRQILLKTLCLDQVECVVEEPDVSDNT